MHVETESLALFKTTKGALLFAYNVKHGHALPSGLAAMMGGPRPVGRGLGGLDGAGQAGMILAEVGAIEPELRQRILAARYAVNALPCTCRNSCCSGFKPNPEWMDAISHIMDIVRVAALSGTVSNYGLRQTLVMRYFGVRQSLTTAAESAGVNRDTASAHANKVIAFLREEERLARWAIEERLKVAGIVE